MLNNDTCLITKRLNTTAISNVYEGIPENILLNVVFWTLLIFLFTLLRNRAWNYGRLALIHAENWRQLFYANPSDAVAVEDRIPVIPDTNFLWFLSVFRISKERFFTRCGPDACHYLSFQKHLLMLSATITAVAVGIILPTNFQGNLQGDETTFGHTTMSNLVPTSNWLWVHVIASFCFVPLTILIMRRCSGRIRNATALTSRTIMVTHIAHGRRNEEDIRRYFEVIYPDLEIEDIQIAYRVKQLSTLEKQRKLARECKMYCIRQQKSDLKVQPDGCIACCPWGTQDALEYYMEEEVRLTDLVIAERRRVLEKPLGIAFVTVGSEDSAQQVIKSFKPGSMGLWMISRAPLPSDINWKNLEMSYRNWYSKAILINLTLFIVLFFLTTPLIVVNILNNLAAETSNNFVHNLGPFITDLLPPLLLLAFSALMPVLVRFSDEWMSYWTKSKQNHATMHKTFFFLLFMVLILPSLGLTSAQAFVELSFEQTNASVHWECFFLPDKGAFFVNYIITSAFIGTALQLLRFPELAVYCFRLLRIKSSAEKAHVRKEIMSEFPLGFNYAWTLLIFTISTVYSLTCPLITPFGLVYLCLKHFVDKYNLYYVYKPIRMCQEGKEIHADAVRMVRVAVILLQLIMIAFCFVRGGWSSRFSVAFVGFIVTWVIFFFLSPFPLQASAAKNNVKLSESSERYIPPVLLSSQNLEQDYDQVSSSSSSYGSVDINETNTILEIDTLVV